MLNSYIYLEPNHCNHLTSILDHQPPKIWSFRIKTEVKWVPIDGRTLETAQIDYHWYDVRCTDSCSHELDSNDNIAFLIMTDHDLFKKTMALRCLRPKDAVLGVVTRRKPAETKKTIFWLFRPRRHVFCCFVQTESLGLHGFEIF